MKYLSAEDYKKLHAICPICKSTRLAQTLIDIAQYSDRDYEDNLNRANCFDCGWKGTVKELIPIEEYSKEKLVIITGPSGYGKTTFKEMLCEVEPFKNCVTCTTREARREEADGFHYHFRSVEEFKRMIADGEMLEYQEVYPGKFYGTPMISLEEIWSRRKIPAIILDVAGAIEVKKRFPSALLICIRVPNNNVLEKRLIDRNTENAYSIYERIQKSATEMDTIFDSGLVDNYVMNENLEKAFFILRNIALSYVNELTLKDLTEEFEDNITYRVGISSPEGIEMERKSGREWKKLSAIIGEQPVNIYHDN